MWIVRNQFGNLVLFKDKPYKDLIIWRSDGDFEEIEDNEGFFSCVRWEDEEPKELILK